MERRNGIKGTGKGIVSFTGSRNYSLGYRTHWELGNVTMCFHFHPSPQRHCMSHCYACTLAPSGTLGRQTWFLDDSDSFKKPPPWLSRLWDTSGGELPSINLS